MYPPRPPLPLLGLLIVVVTGLAGCTTSGGSDAPAEPDVAVEVQNLRDRCAALETENIALKRQRIDLQRQLMKLLDEKELLENLVEIARNGGSIEAYFSPPAIEATVQKVNRKQNEVMLSVGSDDKVEKGFRFAVIRGGHYIGNVQVDHVYPKACAASIIRVVPDMMIEVGDLASTRP